MIWPEWKRLALMETDPLLLLGKTILKELAALLERCQLLSNDRVLSMAAAVGNSTITIFGPSDDRKYRL